MGNQVAKVFVSWSHQDQSLKEDLLDRLMPRLKILRDVEVLWWMDSHLQIGEAFRREIVAKIDECDYGLHLLSPSFLASDFIREHEVPPFVGDNPRKKTLPVGLVETPFGSRVDWAGFDPLQVFTLEGSFYNQVGGARRDRFAAALTDKIQQRIVGTPGWRR